MMSRSEVRHQGQRLLEFTPDLRCRLLSEWVHAWAVGRQQVLLPGVNIVGVEIKRTELHGLVEPAHGVVGLPTCGRQQPQTLVGQGTPGSEFPGLQEVRFGSVEPADGDRKSTR